MNGLKKIVLLLLVVFIAIQFIQPVRNTNGQVLPTDISKVYSIPNQVQSVLKHACYDCHSNNTIYPWYSYIQPGGWWLASHIKSGKAELNFSEFGDYSNRRQRSKLNSIAKTVEDGTMPFSSYTFMHSEARLTKEEKALIIHWANTTKDSLSLKN